MEITDVRVRFMGGLAKLCAPERAEEAAGALVAMLPMLGDVPPHAWASRGFLDAVATHRRRGGVPSYAEFREALNGWRRDNPPPMLSAPDDPMARLSADARIWVEYYQRRAGEGFAPFGTSPGGEAHVLSVVKGQSADAWSHITGIPLRTERPDEAARQYVSALVQEWRDEYRPSQSVQKPSTSVRTAPPLTRDELSRRYAAAGLFAPQVSANGN